MSASAGGCSLVCKAVQATGGARSGGKHGLRAGHPGPARCWKEHLLLRSRREPARGSAGEHSAAAGLAATLTSWAAGLLLRFKALCSAVGRSLRLRRCRALRSGSLPSVGLAAVGADCSERLPARNLSRRFPGYHQMLRCKCGRQRESMRRRPVFARRSTRFTVALGSVTKMIVLAMGRCVGEGQLHSPPMTAVAHN